jgi:multiple sugar transport system substrate-binding protein
MEEERMNGSKRRRRLIGLASALVLAATAAACGGSSSSTDSSSSGTAATPGTTVDTTTPVKLTMWWWGDQEAAGLKGYVEESVKAYEALHPNITIDTVLQSTDNLVPAFQAAAQAKTGPDIQYFWGGIYTLEPYWAGGITPISDIVGADEAAHYINKEEVTAEGKVVTAGWYIQPSFPLLVRTDVLARAGIAAAPATWDELIADCKTLRGKGITPIAGGIKDGWFGGWLYSILGSQSTSAADVKSAVIGDAKFTDAAHTEWWTRLKESVDAKCWNNDIGSVDLYQGQQQWSDGKAAMTVTAGTDVRKFLTQVGADKVQVSPLPPFGTGPGANKLGSTSQTLGVTSFSKHQAEAGAFITFLHTPERLQAFYKATGAFPADDRFDTSAITEPQLKNLHDLATSGAPYLENFIPSELDAKAVFAGSQGIFAGSTTPAKAAADMQSIMERLRTTNPDLVDNYKKWAAQ